MNRRGFALLAVLWVIALAAALGLAATLSAREMVGAARNRTLLAQGLWAAEGCAALARALIDSALADARMWDRLDESLAGRRIAGCDLRLEPAGVRLDVNAATGEQLARLLAAVRVEPARSDSLVAALLDWRDADDAARPGGGAEREWYAEQRLFAPRNGPIADLGELRRARGFDELAGLDSLLGTEPGRIAVNYAPLAVLAALPGASPELLAAVGAARLRRAPITQLSQLAELVSGPPRDSLLAQFGDLVAAATTIPDAWILRVAPLDSSAPRVSIELRLVLAGNRAAVVRRRGW